jgi:uncharacterized protein
MPSIDDPLYRRHKPATAGALLRQACKRASLSQVDLAARAGVTQSVIRAYESGQRQPSIPALARLVDAASFELTLGLRRPPGRSTGCQATVGRRVRCHRIDLIVMDAHRVSNLRVFGSVARGDDRADSDVDLLADFPPGLSLFRLGLCRARTRTMTLSWCFLCPLGCSPVLADQTVDHLSALDPGGHIDRLAGLVQRRSLFPRLVGPMMVVMLRILGQSPPEVSFAVD